MKYFLLVYDKRRGKILEQREYPVAAASTALADRNTSLHEFRGRDVEVVLLGARSIEDLKKTHGRYFRDTAVQRAFAAG